MSKKESDIVQDASVVRNLLTKFDNAEEPSAKATKAAEALRKALDAVAEKREALAAAMEG
jgi:hypothetical protein